MRSALAVALALAPGPAPLAAQQVFPSGVELVAVDVTVVDREGRPVADLRPQDFEVTVGRRRRRVVSTQLVRHVAPVAGRRRAGGDASLRGSSYSSNQDVPSGRLIVLVPDVGWMSTGGGRAAIQAAVRFLGRLEPEDRVALFTIPVGPSVDFTADHARVAEAIQKVRGGSRMHSTPGSRLSLGEAMTGCTFARDPLIWNAAAQRECGVQDFGGSSFDWCVRRLENEARQTCGMVRSTTEMSVGALRRVFDALRTLDGPKTVVLISQGLVTGRSAGGPGADSPFEVIAEAAARARVSLYTVLVDRGFMEAADVSERQLPQTRALDESLFRDGLEAVAGYSGGPLLKTLTTADFAFERVASETSATWLLSFEPEGDDRDGKAHDIRVTVARDGVEVRARPRFVVEPTSGTPPSAEAQVRRSLDGVLPETQVPLVLTSLAFGEKEGNVRVVLATEIGLGGEPADAVAVGFRLLDAEGRVAAGTISTGRLDRVRSLGGDALYYVATPTLKPGTYLLKLAAAAPSGRSGSVERIVEARLTPAGSMLVSDLLVAEPGRRDSGMVVSVDGRLLGRTARAALEVRNATTPPAVQYELAPIGEPGARLIAGASVHPTAEPGCYEAEAMLDLGPLEPGRYELRAVVLLPDGSEAGRVARPLELSTGGE